MKIAALVTTEFRGVFYGEYDPSKEKNLPSEITLENARNVIYWDSSCNGFMGLAAEGPTPSCKIGGKVNSITLYKITSITPVSERAEEKWNSLQIS